MGSNFQTDHDTAQQWLADQAREIATDDDERISKPLHDLDPATVCAVLMLICSPSENGKIAWKTALRRLAVIASHVLVDVGSYSLDSIAKQLTEAGVPTCRAALSVANVQLSDITGFHRTEKTLQARESYRIAACKAWQKSPTRSKKKARSS